MSDEAPDREQQTEDPSQRKLDEAHRKGDVAKSQEVTTWFMMVGSALLFLVAAPISSSGIVQQLSLILGKADQFSIGGTGFNAFVTSLATTFLLIVLVPLGIMSLFGVAANLVQHRPLLTVETIKPKLSKISLVQGAKRLFSLEALVNFTKGLAKLTVVALVLFFAIWGQRDELDTLISMDLAALMPEFQQLALKIFAATIAVVTLIAVADYLYQRQRWWQKQKMTIKEVRDEHKNQEGDPQIKARIRQIRQEKSRRRMMASVPEATVIITNPTHFAVALKYDRAMPAPKCVAKGMDAIALRIREKAREHEVPIVENPPLARALYASVDIDETIPAEHFKAVAQVIGYVMRLRQKSAWRSASA
ncbi:MAG: flagellar biosynthesis protein FlhB [Hyphomicrobiaceae bacterium]|nr:flagellar biosynthesis protein FlhB [Hyphomicrobiaceae bacterium]